MLHVGMLRYVMLCCSSRRLFGRRSQPEVYVGSITAVADWLVDVIIFVSKKSNKIIRINRNFISNNLVTAS